MKKIDVARVVRREPRRGEPSNHKCGKEQDPRNGKGLAARAALQAANGKR
jgi:hypothetical protein